MDQNKSDITRRSFLAGTGAVIGGFAAGAILGTNTKKAEAAAGTLPYGWKTLDINQVKQAAFDAYFVGGCCYGAAYALIQAQRTAWGAGNSAWDDLPEDMFRFGAGGAMGWGTICGGLNGAIAVSYVALGPAHAQQANIVDRIMQWYSDTSLPSSDIDAYVASSGKPDLKTPTIAKSPLCHDSVSQWCRTVNKNINSAEKKCRCAKLTADVAGFMADLLNQASLGSTISKLAFDATTADCTDCHLGTGNNANHGGTAKLDNDQGKMACGECHEDGGKNIATKCSK